MLLRATAWHAIKGSCSVHVRYSFGSCSEKGGRIRTASEQHPNKGITKPLDGGQLTVLEETNYYPFGLQQKGYNNTILNVIRNPLAEKNKFNGKEYQDEVGLNVYDYGARNYDPALGKWMNIDPLAEKRNWLTPYNFVQNNPLNKIDPHGESDTDFLNTETGQTTHVEDGREQIALVNNVQFQQVQSLHSLKTWNRAQSEQYLGLATRNVIDFNSDLGLLTRLAFTQFKNQELDAKMIAAESVLNRIEYNKNNGEYVKYSVDLQVSTVREAIYAPGGYAQTPSKYAFNNPYGFVTSSEANNIKGTRNSLLEAAYAAYKVTTGSATKTGVIYYNSLKAGNNHYKTYTLIQLATYSLWI